MSEERAEPLVEILFFDGCPNHEAARAMVERVSGELGLEPQLRLVEVPDQEAAQRLRFLGSPTIRVDGLDIDPHAQERDQYVLSCRVYRTDAGFAGQPDERWLRDALQRETATEDAGWQERVLRDRQTMARPVDRDALRDLLEQGAQLVEVLPADEYEYERLPGAINIPLKTLNAETASRLDRGRAVIVYCYDSQWDMSPRAASRLEELGFTQVYDYTAGKADWASFGLALEGDHDSSTRVGAHVRTDVPACGPADRMPDVRQRARAAGWGTCFVTDERRVVLGRLGRAALAGDDDVTVEEAMSLGPSTVRPSLELDKAVERMHKQRLTTLPVTRSDGVLIGVLRREDAERALE